MTIWNAYDVEDGETIYWSYEYETNTKLFYVAGAILFVFLFSRILAIVGAVAAYFYFREYGYRALRRIELTSRGVSISEDGRVINFMGLGEIVAVAIDDKRVRVVSDRGRVLKCPVDNPSAFAQTLAATIQSVQGREVPIR